MASGPLRTRGSCRAGGRGRERNRCSVLNQLAAEAAVTGTCLAGFTMEEGEEGLVRGATDEKADVDAQDDLPLLTDEKFDFDLSLSSSSANEDEEVFFGLVGHRERCVTVSPVPREAELLTWSPVPGEKFVEIFKEAHLLALQIASSAKKAAPRVREPKPVPAPGSGEEFVQEARLKLDIFERGLQVQRSSPALKRETYCVPTPEGAPVRASLTFAESPGAPEPASSARLQSQGVAERKAASRLPPPRSLSVPGKGAPAKPQPGTQTHPSRLPAGSARVSSGAVPLDQSSGTSEASASFGSGSGTKGPPGLHAPSKFGARKMLLKPPGPTKTLLRGKSASFSGPVCGMNLTPARGSAKPGDPFLHLADTPRPKLSDQLSHGNISCPKQTRVAPAAPLASRAKEAASVSLRQPQTPKTGIQRLSSTPSLSQPSQLTKPRGYRGPSSGAKAGLPTNLLRRPAFTGGASPDSGTPQVQSVSRRPSGPSFGSAALCGTPAQCSSGGAAHPPGSSTHTPLSVRRLSALPTPSRRQASALPSWPTPRSGLRATSLPQLVAAQPPSQASPKKARGRPEQAQETSRPGAPCPSDPPLGVPLALNFASPEQTVPGTPGKEAKEQPRTKPAPPEAVLIHVGPNTRTSVPAMPKLPLRSQPLIDFSNSPEADPRWLPLKPAKASASEGQLLIDLFHSPEVAKSVPSKPLPATGQLIDLSSPLISLSPVEDKENLDSPLLKF
ncbi:G2 and S phase-expressed protein 1 isoform X2 [Phascolarctos cinereus]|uniref:G2 and S phase-expressed protein 1 isoform X2 n=1 Tax=Phascolarctos cinereus TaxID=38626 RepID=A0A6P5JPF3_PHACI|nr:G2 and S phase-expressed protein 1 isoform X2 [Phascolarctos cinereus]